MEKHLSWFKMPEQALEALINRDLDRASALIGIKLDSFFCTDDAVRLWRNRLMQAQQDVRTLDWIAQVVAINQEVIGHAGFHGTPDDAGMVEVAYCVMPAYRGQGYAKLMLRDLLHRATLEPDVKIVRATIGPDNAASLATIVPFEFVHKGDQWDDLDGLELIFEKEVG